MSALSQFTIKIIKDLRTTLDGVVCNTSKFVKAIPNIQLDNNESLASLGIQDLYANIPVNKDINVELKHLEKSHKWKILSLTKADIKDLLHLALKNSDFQLNDKFYKQKPGLPMGNTISSIP